MNYEITNRPFTIMEMHLEKGESFRSKPDMMAWMSPSIRMETRIDAAETAIKKAVVGRVPITQYFFAEDAGEVALSLKEPGDILMFDVRKTPIIVQKQSFFCCTDDVKLEVFLHEKVSTGAFGGTGFLMEKYTERGCVWVGIDGSLKVKELEQGESMVVAPDYISAMETTCSMEVQWVRGASNVVLGGEGLFHTVITGPGKVWLQTAPLKRQVNEIGKSLSMVGTLLK